MAFDASIVPSLIGMVGSTVAAIPGMKKAKRPETGRAAARNTTEFANKVVGSAAAGHGASRGLALREGLRGAAEAARGGSEAAANQARQDEQTFEDRKNLRRDNIMNFATGAAEGLAQMTQGFIKPEDSEMKKMSQEALQQQPEMQAEQNATGLAGPTAGIAPSQEALTQSTEAMIDPQGATLNELEAEFQDEENPAGPEAAFKSTKALEELLTSSPTVASPALEADLENRLSAKKLMMQDAERLGYSLDGIMAQINRRFQLKPGQSTQNPLGVSLDMPGLQGEE